MDTQHEKLLKGIVDGLVESLGFEATTEVSADPVDGETLCCRIRMSGDQNYLIGQYGTNLAAVQHLVRAMFRRQAGEPANIIVDVNDYFAGKKALLEQEAEKAADEALRNNVSVALRPMFPYERKIVHAHLSLREDVMTESVGEGNERKVFVRPKPSAA